MTRATLSQVLAPALAGGHAVPGLVCLGWEDARAYVAAAEAEGCAAILQAGPACRAHTPLPVLAAMFGHLADAASVPIVLHLDHGYTLDECAAAIDAGFTSVMIDGSSLPLAQNIALSAQVARLAHAAGVSVEAEIGHVGYQGGGASHGTDPAEAARMAQDSGADALAVSVGNLHLQTGPGAALDEDLLARIQAVCPLPLVIHGGSGVPGAQRARLAAQTAICKFNIGTELRQVFGSALRASLAGQPGQFDRIALLAPTHDPLVAATRAILRQLRPGRADDG